MGEIRIFSIKYYFFRSKGGVLCILQEVQSKLKMLENLLSGITLQSETIPNWLVIAMGIGTVFVGLICIIIICKIMSLFFVKRSKSDTVVPATPVAAAPAKETVIENRQEIIAAVAAVAAEELGTDISAIRIHSFKKI